jgi:hypothetical protein
MSDPEPPVLDIQKVFKMKKRSGIKKSVIRDIKDAPDGDFKDLVSGLGRVARAMTYDNGDEADLYISLTYVASVAASLARSAGQKKPYRAIHLEMNQAVFKHTWSMTPLNPQMPDGQKLVVLVEEVGEAADDPDDAHELIQIATMAGAWAASLRATKTQDWVTT